MISIIRFIKFRLIANQKYSAASKCRTIEKKLTKWRDKLSAIF